MSIQVYVVIGSTGEYDEFCQWSVCAYQDRSRAEDHARLAQEDAVAIAKEKGSRWSPPTRNNKYDPKMYMDGDEVRYSVVDIDLLDAIPGIDG